MFAKAARYAPALRRAYDNVPLPIVGPSSPGEVAKTGSAHSINWYPVPPEAKGDLWQLRSRPGLELLGSVPRYPFRGWCVHQGRLFAVGKEKIYEIFDDGTPTEWGRIGTATGRVVMASLLDTIVIGDGLGFYSLDTGTGLVAPVADAPKGTFCVRFDLRILYQGENGQVFYSEVNDPTNIPGANFFDAESLPDEIVAITTTEDRIWLHGSDSAEPWYDSGDVDNPFARIPGGVSYHGCQHPFTALRLDGSIWMVGKDKDGADVVLRSSGVTFMRVSTPSVERFLKASETVTAFSYQEDGETFYCLNSEVGSWAFGLKAQEWAERAWLNQGTGVQERQRAEFHAFVYGIHMVGDYATGAIYRQGLDIRSDDGEEIRRTRITQRMSAGGRSSILAELWLDFATGVGLDGSGQGTDPQVMLQVAPDGVTLGTELVCPLGKIGEYGAQVRFFDLGVGRDWVFAISVSDPVFTGLMGAEGKFVRGRR